MSNWAMAGYVILGTTFVLFLPLFIMVRRHGIDHVRSFYHEFKMRKVDEWEATGAISKETAARYRERL